MAFFYFKNYKIIFFKLAMFTFSYDLDYIPSAVAVFAHPLLKNIKNVDKYSLENENVELFSNQSEISKPEFLDPLTASIAQVSSNSLQICNETHLKPSTSVIEELAGKILNNSLVDKVAEENLELDPELVGFRHWREYKAMILKGFKTDDRLSLESSFLERRGSLYMDKKRYIFKF